MNVKCIAMGSLAANCYLVKTDDVVIVIDPFECSAEVEEFFLANQNLEKYILLTHCHFDHIMGAKTLREKVGAKIAIGEYDEEGLMDKNLSLTELVGLKHEPFSADILFKDGDILKVGDTEIEVIHTPGHTAGSVCYKLKNLLFTGDTLFKQSIGRTDFPTGDYVQIKRSLEKLKNICLKEQVILPGHSESTTMQEELAFNPYL